MARPPLPVGSWGRISRRQIAPRRWAARARFRDADGVTRQVEAVGASGAGAERALVLAMQERRSATADEITAGTRLSALGDFWLRTEVDDSDRAVSTRQRYREVVTVIVGPGVGGLLVREATVPRLERYVRTVTAERGPSTARLVRVVLAGMLSVAVRHGAIAGNPMRDVSTVRVVTKEVRALSVEEVRRLRADLAGDLQAIGADLVDLVDLLLATGARIGEALALRWEDVDLDSGTAALTGTVVRLRPGTEGPGHLVRQDTTKGRKTRRLRLPAFAVALLRERITAGRDGGEHDLVLPSAVATLRDVATVERQWRGFRDRHLEWSWVTLHTFRKTVGTAVDRSRGTRDAAAQLGHTSEAIRTRHYVERELVGPDVTEVLERFGALLPVTEQAPLVVSELT